MKKRNNGKPLTTSEQIGQVARALRTLPMKTRIEFLVKANLISAEEAQRAIAKLGEARKEAAPQ